MADGKTDGPEPRKPLRLWPGVVVAVLAGVLRYVVPLFAPEMLFPGVLAGLVGALVIVVWWAFFSRAPGAERWGGLALLIVAPVATFQLLDRSIATGMMGMMFVIYAVPAVSLAFVAWAVAARRLSPGARRAAMVATVVVACAAWTLVRTRGMTGDGVSDFAWRWGETAEERLLVRAGEEPEASVALPEAPIDAEWPGFRGPGRDDVIPGVRIATDWSQSPPVELWRRPIGPGWSSFAVRGDFLYTQEQRGEDEVVACYRLSTGEPVWRHRDAARFWESNAGAGPRATPTLRGERVYTLGATGILNVLEAIDGTVVWSRDAVSDAEKEVPAWGIAGSPLVVDDLVVVAVAGRLVAYDLATGEPRWRGPSDGGGYSSPHLATVDGVRQVLLLDGNGAIGVAPADGAVLWRHRWPGDGIVQPAFTADGDVLIGTGTGMGRDAGLGVRRIAVAHGAGGWTTEERWTSVGLKPYFNDFVVHDGNAFGFDGSILSCIDLADGERRWKGGRYGHGQLMLLADQGLLLVLSEQGELALVRATADGFEELARVPAIEGKTWNHPVLAGDVLLARNGQEMAAFRLPLAG